MFFCNQKNQKFRGSDSPDPKTASQGGLKGSVLYGFNVGFVFSDFPLLYRRLYSNTQFSESAEIARLQRKMMLAISR